MIRNLRPGPVAFCLAAVLAMALVPAAEAIPQWARSTGRSCVECHSVLPKLNANGEAFLARGYRLPAGRKHEPTVPLALWITGRYETRSLEDLEKVYLPKVELISGGPIGESLSYFVEWRVVSLELRNDGSLRDRGGRFEDAFLTWDFAERHSLTVGQFRSLNQYDVSLRLSVSEPSIFSASLPGDPHPNRRIQALRGFAPAARSPGVTYELHSIQGRAPSDGLFHYVNVPLVGELSIPLSDEARREASFELQGPLKGVFLETFYRRGLNSIGAHAFIGDRRWLVTGVGRVNYHDFHATAGLGVDQASGRSARIRSSLEVEYLPDWWAMVRPGAGFRVENITRTGRSPAYIPYFVVAGPNSWYSFLLQVQGRFQGEDKSLVMDLSAFF